MSTRKSIKCGRPHPVDNPYYPTQVFYVVWQKGEGLLDGYVQLSKIDLLMAGSLEAIIRFQLGIPAGVQVLTQQVVGGFLAGIRDP